MLSKKLGLVKLITAPASVAALALIGTLTFVSQGCTVITSDGTLDGGGFTGNDAGPQLNSCNECLFQGCTGQWAVCQNNTECMAIYTCATKPSCAADQSCIDACFAAHPTGKSSYYALASCDFAGQCNACASTCGGAPSSCPAPVVDSGVPDAAVDAGTAPDASPPPPDGGSVQSCTECTTTKCSAEKAACANATPCDKYTQCLAACADVPCIDKCGTDNPDGKNASAALSTCVSSGCSAECGL